MVDLAKLRLNKEHSIELSIITISVLITLSIFTSVSFLIPIINDPKAYVPDFLDYLRTFILSTTCSIVINYSFRFIHRVVIVLKVPLEFMVIYLLAYPQKQDRFRTFSKFNLDKRQIFYFGLFYQIFSLIFYLFDQFRLMKEIESVDLNNLKNLHKVNEIRSKSTISNCLEIRRNSNSLRKILYPESYDQSANNISNIDTIDETSPLIIDHSSPIQPIKSTSSYGSITSLIITSQPSSTLLKSSDVQFESLIVPMTTSSHLKNYFFHLIWIITSTFYELGIALILSIPFFYIPKLSVDHKFSPLEEYYYNNLQCFIIEIIIPLIMLISALFYLIYKNSQYSSPNENRIDEDDELNDEETPREKSLYGVFGVYVLVSVMLFIIGMHYTT